jgi:serine/threonine protein kinase
LGGPLPPDVAKSYGLDLAEAILHLKSLDLVHRDIKPDNIMFRQNDDRPVLVDLGIVRDLSLDSLTQSWVARGPGTPYFSSPEQLNNEKHLVDWRSDQFSLGIVLSISSLGKHPYEFLSGSPEAVINAVANREPLPSTFKSEIQQVGLEFVSVMVEPWPIRRYQTPDEMIEAMRGT